jgi:hypothetical protein
MLESQMLRRAGSVGLPFDCARRYVTDVTNLFARTVSSHRAASAECSREQAAWTQPP